MPQDIGRRPSAQVQNFSTPEDGGGGIFLWDEKSTLPDDGGAVIQPDKSGPAGRWVRQAITSTFDSGISKPTVLDPRWWGAKTDGSDSTAAFTAMMNAASSYDPKGYGIAVDLSPGNWNTGKIPTHRAVMWKGAGERVTSWTITLGKDELWMDVPEGNVFDGIQFGRNRKQFRSPLFRVAAAAGFRNIFANMNGPFVEQDGGNLSMNNVSIFPGGTAELADGLAMIDIQNGNFIGREVGMAADNNRSIDVAGIRVESGNVRLDIFSARRLGVGIEVAPPAGKKVAHVYASGLFLYDMIHQGLRVAPQDRGLIGQVEVYGADIGYAGTKDGSAGVLVGGAGGIGSFAHFGGNIHNGGGSGIEIDRPQANVLINGTMLDQNNGDGIHVADGSSGFQILAIQCGNGGSANGNKGFGINIAGKRHEDFDMRNVRCHGNRAGDVKNEMEPPR